MGVRTAPASTGQRLLWLLDHHRGDGGLVNDRLAWRISGPLDVEVLQQTFDALVARHEALRTTFTGSGARLVQVVRPPYRAHLLTSEVTPLGGLDQLEDLVSAAVETAIDPAAMTMRADLWRLGEDNHVLLLSINPLVTDHRSNVILATDLAALYEAFARGLDPNLPKIGWQYVDWSEWQRASFAAGRLAELRMHWAEALVGARTVVLPERPADAHPGEKAYQWRHIPDECRTALARIANDYDTSPFAVSLAAFFVHLYGLTGQSDVVIGSLFANRAKSEVLDTIGLFANLVALRGHVSPEGQFTEVLRDTTSMVASATAHQELPYHMLPAGTRAHEVIFQFVEGEPRPTALTRIKDLTVVPIERQSARPRFTLEMFVAYMHDRVSHVLLYDRARIDDRWACRFADDYVHLLGAVAAAPMERSARSSLHVCAVSR